LSGHQPNHPLRSWEDIARGAAAQLKRPARNISYIEARGFLCYELMHLLGGCIEFVETPWKNVVLKALEFFFPIAPVCRWVPPRNSELAQVGCYHTQETVVYRLLPVDGPVVIFFVNYKPEPPIGGWYIRSLFNVPQLDLRYFLRPPFTKDNRDAQLDELLRSGMTEKFDLISPMTEAAADHLAEETAGMNRAMWEEFSRK